MAARQELMRREIRDAAARLFMDRGITSVTLKDVASEVGISKATIYNYFDNKDELVRFVFGDWAKQSVVPFQEIADSDEDPETKIRRVVQLRVLQMVDDSNLFALSIQEEHRIPEAIREDFRRSKRIADHLVQDVIRQGQDAGVFVGLEPHLVEFALMGMCNWLWRWYDPEGPETAEAIVDTFTRILLRGIRSGDAPPESARPEVTRHLAGIQEHVNALASALDR